jgi:hypothetical protein
VALISTARFTAQTDRFGKIYDNLLAFVSGTEGTNVATGLTNAVSDIQSYDDDPDLQVDLLADTRAVAKALASGGAAYTALVAQLRSLLTAVQRQIGANGGTSIDRFCTDNAVRVSSSFRDLCAALGVTVSAANVFKATKQTLATETVTGAGAGTFSGTGSLDTSLYGPLACEVECLTAIGVTPIVATLTMVKADATTQAKTVTLTASSLINSLFAVGTSTDLYVDCSAVTFTGGTAAEQFRVQTKILRSPSL